MHRISVFRYIQVLAFAFGFCCKFFLEPILAVDIALNDEGNNIVARCVYHGCGRIDEVAQSQCNGECDCEVVGEEQRAQNELTRAAAAGNAAHCDGGEHSNDDRKNYLAGVCVDAEETEQEQHLDNGTHCRAVHVHRCTHREHDIADLTGNAGVLGGFHVSGDSSNGGACAEGNCGRLEQVLEHDLDCTLAAAEACVDGEEDKHVDKADYIVMISVLLY